MVMTKEMSLDDWDEKMRLEILQCLKFYHCVMADFVKKNQCYQLNAINCIS